jgi:hypothetical protein
MLKCHQFLQICCNMLQEFYILGSAACEMANKVLDLYTEATDRSPLAQPLPYLQGVSSPASGNLQ